MFVVEFLIKYLSYFWPTIVCEIFLLICFLKFRKYDATKKGNDIFVRIRRKFRKIAGSERMVKIAKYVYEKTEEKKA